MNRRILTLVAAGAAASFAVALPLTAAPKGTNHNSSADETTNCGGDNTLTIRAPEQLWPPNHKYFTDISVTADDGDESSNITLESAGTHDQYEGDTGTEETNGSGKTADDITTNGEDPTLTTSPDDGQTIVHTESASDTVTTSWKARAERSGRIKDGRTYTITAVATFNDGDSSEDCMATDTITVPHDMRKSTRS